jgi:serine/threonine-protein kinase
MFCSLCSRESRDGAKFCDGCGAALDATVVRDTTDPELEQVRSAFKERYIVESLLGRGGMGSVYKARERTLDRYVALKIVAKERSHDEQFVDRFRREARLAARLRHPRIVSVHEVGALGGFPYFSMDYIEGGTLRSVVARRRALPAEDAIGVIAEICRAVAHAHGKGIIHRDLKPENVMIDTEGDVFVMDFGLARAVGEANITHSGVVMGSPFYMSPEQLAGESADERSDIYALGLILWFCLTGDDLFAAETITGVVAKHMSTQIRDVVRTNAQLPPNLHEVLVSMLEEQRDRRARSVKELLERLTLRKIVALGLSLTEDEASSQPTEVTPLETMPSKTAPEDASLQAASTRRKARLRSLLDDM